LELQTLSLLVSDLHFDLLTLDHFIQGHDCGKPYGPDEPDVKGRQEEEIRFQPSDQT
jgi:hypothetical protein